MTERSLPSDVSGKKIVSGDTPVTLFLLLNLTSFASNLSYPRFYVFIRLVDLSKKIRFVLNPNKPFICRFSNSYRTKLDIELIRIITVDFAIAVPTMMRDDLLVNSFGDDVSIAEILYLT